MRHITRRKLALAADKRRYGRLTRRKLLRALNKAWSDAELAGVQGENFAWGTFSGPPVAAAQLLTGPVQIYESKW